jgi:ADP-ribosylglycohydrolase
MPMLGAIIGDIVGSRFEFNNHRNKDFELFTDGCFVTDDSIMTLAVAKALMKSEKNAARDNPKYCDNLSGLTAKYMREIGRNYPNCGFGGMFYKWIFSDTMGEYNSFGNGAAMRVSPCGFAARTEVESLFLAKTVTEVTHNHPEGIKGAQATALAIFLARNGKTKDEIKARIETDYYKLDFTIDEIRPTYEFNETCQETVPQAIKSFLESTNFEDAIRTAISLGGDSDTLAAITGAIAEAYYGVPDPIKEKALGYLDDRLRAIYDEWDNNDKNSRRILTMGNFQWVPFYEALADKLLTYNDRRDELFELIKKTASEQPLMKYLHFDREDWWGDHHIDPFSVIGIFNRDTTDVNRTDLARVLANIFDIDLDVPTQFTGIPVLNNRNSFFSGRDDVWDLFVLAIESMKIGNLETDFISAFDKALAAKGNGIAYITMGLYWIRPNFYMPLDGNSRSYISANYGITAPIGKNCGNEYISFLKNLKAKVADQSPNLTFPEISYIAWTQKGDKPPIEVVNKPESAVKKQTPSTTQKSNFKMEKNIILYGSPGTGKTYSTVQYAVSIIEEKSLDLIKDEDYESVFARYEEYSDKGLIAFTTFHQSYCYEEFIEGIRPVVTSEDKAKTTKEIEYELHDGIFKKFCDTAGTPMMKIPNRVFVIDEINRGNISKIFGELITLIEPSKRIGASEQRRAILPYSGQNFGIPGNIYIIGTMNTADRSIAMIDTALRRRFEFVEMLPKSSVLAGIYVDNYIDITEMHETINKRITVLLDREHTIGHSYFLPLKKEPTLEMLAKIFKGKIIPLLQEYFYDDYEKIQLVLGDNQKLDDSTRFIIKKNDSTKLFGNAEADFPGYYEINNEAFTKVDSYAKMR